MDGCRPAKCKPGKSARRIQLLPKFSRDPARVPDPNSAAVFRVQGTSAPSPTASAVSWHLIHSCRILVFTRATLRARGIGATTGVEGLLARHLQGQASDARVLQVARQCHNASMNRNIYCFVASLRCPFDPSTMSIRYQFQRKPPTSGLCRLFHASDPL